MENDYWVDRNVRSNLVIATLGFIVTGIACYFMQLTNTVDYSIIPQEIILTSGFGIFFILLVGASLMVGGAVADFSIKVEIEKGAKK